MGDGLAEWIITTPRRREDGKPIRFAVTVYPADRNHSTATKLQAGKHAVDRWVGSAAIAVNPDFPRLPLAKRSCWTGRWSMTRRGCCSPWRAST